MFLYRRFIHGLFMVVVVCSIATMASDAQAGRFGFFGSSAKSTFKTSPGKSYISPKFNRSASIRRGSFSRFDTKRSLISKVKVSPVSRSTTVTKKQIKRATSKISKDNAAKVKFRKDVKDSTIQGKSRNKPTEPLKEAKGRPHTIIEKPGKNGQYTTHYGDGTWKQYRGSGKKHGGIPRPNVKEAGKNLSPDGRTFIDKGRVRPPHNDEIPRG